MEVVAIGADGATAWSTSFSTGGAVDGPLDLLAAPDHSALLVAWSELPPGATQHRLRVARLDCLSAQP